VVAITFTDPNDESSDTLWSHTFTMSQVQLHDVKRTRGKIYTEIEAEFSAEMNTTDASTGYAPLRYQVINAVETAYS
jgi:hypothetical protein